MKTRHVLLTAAALLGLALAPAAVSAFNFSGCGNFDLLSRDSVSLEQGTNLLLQGNILVTSPTGFVKVGNGNDLKGAVFAHKITLGQGSVVAVCNADIIEGAGKCLVTHTPFTPAPGCTLQPFPPGVSIPSLPALCHPNTALNITVDTTLDPGCYASLKIANGVTLTLQSGEFYAIRQNLQTGIGTAIQSSSPGVPATLFTGGVATFSHLNTLTDLRIFQLGAGTALQIFNGTVLDDTLVVSTTRVVHIHTGSILQGGSALAAPVLDVEPIESKSGEAPPFCTCPAGTAVPGGSPVCLPLD